MTKPALFCIQGRLLLLICFVKLTQEVLREIAGYCDEYLVHGVDVEGKSAGIDEELAKKISKKSKAKSTALQNEEQPQKLKYDSLTQMQSSNLNLKYKFENFVVGSNNKLAYVAAQTVAQHPGIQSFVYLWRSGAWQNTRYAGDWPLYYKKQT